MQAIARDDLRYTSNKDVDVDINKEEEKKEDAYQS